MSNPIDTIVHSILVKLPKTFVVTVQTISDVVVELMKLAEQYAHGGLNGETKKQVVLAILRVLIDQVSDASEKEALTTLLRVIPQQIDTLISVVNGAIIFGEAVATGCFACCGKK